MHHRLDSRQFLRLLCVALATPFPKMHPGAAQGPPAKGAPVSKADVQYRELQRKLAQAWNTWDVNSMTTQVLLPEGLGIHMGFLNNGNDFNHEFLRAAAVGQSTAFPGPHSWDGSYTELRVTWKGHEWRVQTAHESADLVLLVTPLDPPQKFFVPATVAFQVDFLWDRPGTALKHTDFIETHGSQGTIDIYCASGKKISCSAGGVSDAHPGHGQLPVSGAYLAAALTQPVGVSTGKPRSVAEIKAVIEREGAAYRKRVDAAGAESPTMDAIETTLGWDTIYDPEHARVISPVSRDWSANWGGYVLFGWDTFFGATLAGMGDKELAYANVMEGLREETTEGFVPNYARTGGWKSSDRSEPPVGSMTVLDLYRKYHDRWFLDEAYEPLLRWNRWWTLHREIQGYLTFGSDANEPQDRSDAFRGVRAGATGEAGMDGSPIYDNTVFNPQTHLLEFADVGLMSIYIADCDALSTIADILDKPADAKELRERGARYRAKLSTLWSDERGIFLNKDLHSGQFSTSLSPTLLYPMLARAATPEQATRMVKEHLLNPAEFWGEWVIPAIARDDPAFKDQNYWHGRIWGPMNYLVYRDLCNYDGAEIAQTRRELAQKSFTLLSKEWTEKGHVHENYNAITGDGDDVTNSDKFYHWGALLGYMECVEQGPTQK
jgi:putative isomerase